MPTSFNMILNIVFFTMILFANNVANSGESLIRDASQVCDNQFYLKPTCIDKSTHYNCECDIGFEWNGHDCVSTALNSYFDFVDTLPVRYVYIQKTFPQLNEFTITFWLKLSSKSSSGEDTRSRTVFTYSFGEHLNALRFKINEINSFNSVNTKKLHVQIEILNENCIMVAQHKYSHKHKWVHFAVTWSKKLGEIRIYIDGVLKSTCTNIGKRHMLERAGVFIIGQSHLLTTTMYDNQTLPLNSTLKKKDFDERDSFTGSLYNFNIWDYKQESEEIFRIYNDCGLKFCGNAVKWSDLWQGIRGDLKMIWPVGLFQHEECYTEKFMQHSCNDYCFQTVGAVCREDIEKNLKWPLTVANKTVRVACRNASEDSRYAYRNCTYVAPSASKLNKEDFSQYIATWSTPDIQECVDEELDEFKNEVSIFHTTDNFDETKIIIYANILYNLTMQLFSKPKNTIHDISTVIDIAAYLIHAQNEVIKRNLDLYFYLNYANNDDTNEFFKTFLSVINLLISRSNHHLWNYSLPIGNEAYRLIELTRSFEITIHHFQRLHKLNAIENKIENAYETIEMRLTHIVWRQQIIEKNDVNFNFKFPDRNKNFSDEKATTMTTTKSLSSNSKILNSSKKVQKNDKISKTAASEKNANSNKLEEGGYFMGQLNLLQNKIITENKSKKEEKKNYDLFSIVSIYYSGIERLLPSHNKTFRPQDNNINSVLLTIDLIKNEKHVSLNETNFNQTIEKPIIFEFNYTNNVNISDTRCVHLEDAADDSAFKWSRKCCQLKKKDSITATCECVCLGVFSITNDLYDPTWKPVEIINIPLIFFSYIGCIFVIICALISLACLFYFRTKTATTSIHKNFCIAISLTQLFYMISLSNYNYDKTVCRAFVLINLYLLFTVFAWLMNEAFNLYITITYAAHQSGSVTEAAPQWRFYLLGWLLPLILVIVLVIVKSDAYFAKKVCWFNLDYMWIFVSPCAVMILVSILVMIFSAKEHLESSYTKNEKANKLIITHIKAVWTQIVLITVLWSLSVISLVIYGAVIKYLQAFLNILQGLFLFIFYVLLNDEVRKSIRDKKKQKRLSMKKRNSIMHHKKDSNSSNNVIQNMDVESKSKENPDSARLSSDTDDQMLVYENKFYNKETKIDARNRYDSHRSSSKSVKFENQQITVTTSKTPLVAAAATTVASKRTMIIKQQTTDESSSIDVELRHKPASTSVAQVTTHIWDASPARKMHLNSCSNRNSPSIIRNKHVSHLDNEINYGSFAKNDSTATIIMNDEANSEILWPITSSKGRSLKKTSNKTDAIHHQHDDTILNEEKVTVL